MKLTSGRCRRAVTAAVVCALGLGAPVATASVRAVGVTLVPVGPASAPQGYPFTLRATATNPDPQPVTVDVLFELSFSPDSPVDFQLWTVTIPGLGSAKARLTLTPSQWFEDVGTFHVTPLDRKSVV